MLISLLIFVLILGLVWYAISAIPLPPPVRTIAIVLLCIIAIVMLLNYLPVGGGWHGRLI